MDLNTNDSFESGTRALVAPRRKSAPAQLRNNRGGQSTDPLTNGGGQSQAKPVTQKSDVLPSPSGGNWEQNATLTKNVSSAKSGQGKSHPVYDAQPETASPLSLTQSAQSGIVNLRTDGALGETVQLIVELWRRRQNWHRAEKSLTLQIKGGFRRLFQGDKEQADRLYDAITKNTDHPQKLEGMAFALPLLGARDIIERSRLDVEKELRGYAKRLPGYEYVMRTPGLSAFTLAAIVGECPGVNYQGLLDFATVSKVWKRMCVAVMPDGQRQRKVTGSDAFAHGYSPARRSVLWTIGDSLIKAKGPYRDLYLAYKDQEKMKAEEKGLIVAPTAKIPEGEEDLYLSQGVIHRRAKRKMEKELLKNLWCEWHINKGKQEERK